MVFEPGEVLPDKKYQRSSKNCGPPTAFNYETIQSCRRHFITETQYAFGHRRPTHSLYSLRQHGCIVYEIVGEQKPETIAKLVPHGPPVPDRGSPETNYDRIIEAHRRQCQEHGDALVELYHASGLMEEILRPVPLAMTPNHHEVVKL